MEKKRSIGVTLFGWFEILIGGAGTLLFIPFVFLILNGILNPHNKDAIVGHFFGKIGSVITLPCIGMLITGVGILKLKSWARKSNIFLLPASLIGVIYFVNYIGLTKDSSPATLILSFLILLPALIIVSLMIIYFTRPKVKAQFK